MVLRGHEHERLALHLDGAMTPGELLVRSGIGQRQLAQGRLGPLRGALRGGLPGAASQPRLSDQSRNHRVPATMTATPLGHIGIGVPPTVTSTCRTMRSSWRSATNPSRTEAIREAGFIQVPLFDRRRRGPVNGLPDT